MCLGPSQLLFSQKSSNEKVLIRKNDIANASHPLHVYPHDADFSIKPKEKFLLSEDQTGSLQARRQDSERRP